MKDQKVTDEAVIVKELTAAEYDSVINQIFQSMQRNIDNVALTVAQREALSRSLVDVYSNYKEAVSKKD